MAELKNIRIAISGIYDYALEELPSLQLSLADAPDFVERKRIYKVYRPATVLSSAVDKFKMLPLTHHHPSEPVNEANFRKLAVGYTGENPFIDYLQEKDEVGIRSTALLYDSEVLDAYERGEIQLSPGYIADFEWQNGTAPNGEPYDIVMKEIKEVNHLALLPAGRGGNDAVVLDSRKTIFDIVREQMQKDGAPEGNDNASKEHKKEDEKKIKLNKKGESEWGDVYEMKTGTSLDAAKFLMEKQDGLIENAFVGKNNKGKEFKVGLCWGDESVGLNHLIDKHIILQKDFENIEDLTNTIKKVLENGTRKDFPNKAEIKNGNYNLILAKGENGEFVITSFNYKLNENLKLRNNEEQKQKRKELNLLVPNSSTQEGTPLPATVSKNNLSQDSLPRKTIFEIVQMNIFDQIRYGAI